MPSIGGIENIENREGNLESISSVISEEITGQNQISKSKSSGFAPDPTQKELDTTRLAMAPNKNGDTETEEKAKCPQQQAKPVNTTDMARSSDKKFRGIKDTGNDGELTATEKRIEYKTKPKASSVEILGLSKTPARIKQDVLAPELENTFNTELKRRASSPAKFRYSPGNKIAEETAVTDGGDVEDVTADLGKMQLVGDEGSGFVERMDGEKQPNELTSKGPTKKMSGFPSRQAPYHVGQPASQYHPVTYAPRPQTMEQFVTSSPSQVFHNPCAQQFPPVQQVKVVCPPGRKLGVPGKRQNTNMTYTKLPDGRVIGNLPTYKSNVPQMANMPGMQVRSDTGREPMETTYVWPPTSPTSEINSPDHSMQTAPSPGGYSSTAYSPGQPQPSPMMNSPQSVHSHTDSNGMSTSPSSPDTSDYITLSSPQSVQSVESADSGIASPPHTQQYLSTSGMNSGMVTEIDAYLSVKQQNVDVSNYQYSQQQQQHESLCEDLEKEREISKIIEKLKSGLEAPELSNTNVNLSVQNFIPQQQQQRHPPVRQERISEQPNPPATVTSVQMIQQQTVPRAYHNYNAQSLAQTQVPACVQAQVQVQAQAQAQAQAQQQLQNMENMVNNMSLDLLCSQDEDEDTALHIAISQGEPSLCSAIIKRLVQSGRTDALNIKDKLGQTPLYIAVVTNQPNLVYDLLQNGADIMIPNKEGITPLHYVATKGYARALRAIGCSLFNGNVTNWNINVENKYGMSPLQCAIQAHGRFEQIYDGHECLYVNKLVDSNDTITNLLLLGADPAFQDRRSGYTALHYAVELAPNEKVASNVHIIKLILRMAQNAMELLGVTNYAGNTPLHVVAGRNYDEDYLVSIIDLLISYGAEIDVRNPEKHYPHDLVNKEKKKKVYSRLQGDHMGK